MGNRIISSFTGEHDFLSNFVHCELFYDGLNFSTTEAAFQAAKTSDLYERQQIANAATPGIVKRMGRRVTLRSDWEQIKVDVMLNLLRLKFTRGSEFAEKLDKTGDATLVEGTYWHDQFWGICYCPKHNSEGVNMLGQILMHIRAENRHGAAIPFQPFLLPRKDWLKEMDDDG